MVRELFGAERSATQHNDGKSRQFIPLIPAKSITARSTAEDVEAGYTDRTRENEPNDQGKLSGKERKDQPQVAIDPKSLENRGVFPQLRFRSANLLFGRY